MAVSVTPAPSRHRDRLAEVLLVVGFYVVYDSTRFFVAGGAASAFRNGHAIVAVEDWGNIAPERWLNTLFSHHIWLGLPADFAYATLHYVVTPAVLIWLWRYHHAHYRHARTQLGLATASALVGFVLLPTAPPRLLEDSYGFVDVMAQRASLGWWEGDASTPQGLESLTNDFAAMPSLHVGWALWCGLMLYRYAEQPSVRMLGIAYPAFIAAVVMGTGNHYLLDCVAGAALILLGGRAAEPYLHQWDSLTAHLRARLSDRTLGQRLRQVDLRFLTTWVPVLIVFPRIDPDEAGPKVRSVSGLAVRSVDVAGVNADACRGSGSRGAE